MSQELLIRVMQEIPQKSDIDIFRGFDDIKFASQETLLIYSRKRYQLVKEIIDIILRKREYEMRLLNPDYFAIKFNQEITPEVVDVLLKLINKETINLFQKLSFLRTLAKKDKQDYFTGPTALDQKIAESLFEYLQITPEYLNLATKAVIREPVPELDISLEDLKKEQLKAPGTSEQSPHQSEGSLKKE